MLNSIKAITFILFLGLLAGCNGQNQNQNQMNDQDQVNNQNQANFETTAGDTEFDELVAVLNPTEGNEVSGVVSFTSTEEGVRVEGEINGLDPNSNHGFHIHEFGDCSASDGTSAGGHFNPHNQPHAGPEADERHVGDMGNLTSDENGSAEINYTDSVISFSGEGSILGRGVIVHAGEDDLETQPTGDAGDRLSCGVIGVAQTD